MGEIIKKEDKELIELLNKKIGDITTSSLPESLKSKSIYEIIDFILKNKFDTSGGTFTGKVIASNNTSFEQPQVRNIVLSKESPSLSSMNEGDVFIVYED